MILPRPSLRDRLVSSVPFLVVAAWCAIRAVEIRSGSGIGELVDRPELWSLIWWLGAVAGLLSGVCAFCRGPIRIVGALVVETVVVAWTVEVWFEFGWPAAGSISTFVVVAVLLAQSWGRTPFPKVKR